MAPRLPLLLLPVALLLAAAANAAPGTCSNATCAGLEVRYPFRLNSSGSDCGYPGLGLTCEDNNTSLILSVQSHHYRLINIDYLKHTVAVSDTDAETDEYGPGCPRLYWNLTIDYTSSWLQLTPSDSNITFLYNCKKNITWSSAVELRECQGGGGYGSMRSYVLPDGVSKGTEAYDYECEEVVVAPVLSAHKLGMIGGPGGVPPLRNLSFGGAVTAGFELMYNAHSEQCHGCETSGGWCGYQRDGSASGGLKFTCFCDGGPTSKRCGSERK